MSLFNHMSHVSITVTDVEKARDNAGERRMERA